MNLRNKELIEVYSVCDKLKIKDYKSESLKACYKSNVYIKDILDTLLKYESYMSSDQMLIVIGCFIKHSRSEDECRECFKRLIDLEELWDRTIIKEKWRFVITLLSNLPSLGITDITLSDWVERFGIFKIEKDKEEIRLNKKTYIAQRMNDDKTFNLIDKTNNLLLGVYSMIAINNKKIYFFNKDDIESYADLKNKIKENEGCLRILLNNNHRRYLVSDIFNKR